MVEPTTKTLERVLRAYVAEGSDIVTKAVIPASNLGESKPAPHGLFATVLLITDTNPGLEYSRLTNNGDNLEIDTARSVLARYSVQWFRAGARDAARRFVLWAGSPAGIEYAARRRFSRNRVSEVRQLDTIVTDAWEERAGIDLDIGYVETLTQQADAIAAAGVDFEPDGLAAARVEISA